MKKHKIMFFFLLTIISSAHSQPSGVYFALNQFLNTPFFHEYNEVRERAEKSVRDFKMLQNRYSEEDIQNVADAYNASAENFDRVLINIKEDLLHKEKRKYLISYPTSYSKQVETDLNRAKEFYANTYQKEVARVTKGEITGVALLTALPLVIKYAELAIGIFKKIQDEVKQFNEDMLNKYLIENNRFKKWDEIN
jgi:hypothetical protein